MSYFLFTDSRCHERLDKGAIWTLLIWTVSLLGWLLLLKIEGHPAWLETGGALTVIGGLLVVAKQFIPDQSTAIASWLILAMGLTFPVVFQGMAGLAQLAENAILAPMFMFLPAVTRREQPPAVFIISAAIGGLAFGLAPLI